MKGCQAAEYKQNHLLETRVNNSYKTELDVFNPSTWELTAGGLQVQNQPTLSVKPIPESKNKLHIQNLNVCYYSGPERKHPCLVISLTTWECHQTSVSTWEPQPHSALWEKALYAQGGPCPRLSLLYPCAVSEGLLGLFWEMPFLTTQRNAWLLGFYWKVVW